MLQRDYFEHETPEGVPPAGRIHLGHRRLVGTTGENLWSGSSIRVTTPEALAREIVADWMGSPGHRENLLRPEFTHLGVGIAVGAQGQILATQNFAAARAFLRKPLPLELAPMARLSLPPNALELFGPSTVPGQRLTFQGKTPTNGDSQPLGTITAPTAAGRYQTQFFFPEDRPLHFILIPGPLVEIR